MAVMLRRRPLHDCKRFALCSAGGRLARCQFNVFVPNALTTRSVNSFATEVLEHPRRPTVCYGTLHALCAVHECFEMMFNA